MNEYCEVGARTAFTLYLCPLSKDLLGLKRMDSEH